MPEGAFYAHVVEDMGMSAPQTALFSLLQEAHHDYR